MKLALIILILLHATVHLLAFFKAFHLLKIKQLSQAISRTNGTLWLLTCLLFVATALLFSFEEQLWWILSFIALILSEYLIINNWRDAKFGTIINVIIFIATTLGFIAWCLSDQ